MKDFMLVFRDSSAVEDAFANLSPKEMEAEMAHWDKWTVELTQGGNHTGGHPLLPTGKVLKGKSKKLTDGPFVEGKDIIGGYVLIKANDYDHAVKLSLGCPILRSETGSVEVREVMALG